MTTRLRKAVSGVLGTVLVAAAALTGVVVADVATAPAAAAVQQLRCTNDGLLVQSANGTSPSTVVRATVGASAVTYTTVGQLTNVVNAIGYNVRDGYVYGLVPSAGTVTRFGEDVGAGQEDLGQPRLATTTGAAVAVNSPAGVMDADNHLYIWAGTANARQIGVIDVSTRPTTIRYVTVTGPLANQGVIDISYNPYNDLGYTLLGGAIYSIDLDTGVTARVTTTPASTTTTGSAGGSWSDSLGNLYFFQNQATGRVWKLDPTTNTLTDFGAASAINTFDATACLPPTLAKETLTKKTRRGDVVTYRFTVANPGISRVTLQSFVDTLADSAPLTWVAGSVSPAAPGGGTATISGKTLRIDSISVPGTGRVQFTAQARVAPDATAGRYPNSASIVYNGNTITSDDPTEPGDQSTDLDVLVPPSAADDTTSTAQDVTVSTNVIGNDTAYNSTLDPTSVRLVASDDSLVTSLTVAGEGTYTVNPTTGAVELDPLPTFTGTSSVRYSVADGNGDRVRATLTVTVRPAAAPTGVDDPMPTGYNTPTTVAPFANDDSGAGNATFTNGSLRLTDPATGDPVTSLTVPNEGTYTVDTATGRVTFTPLPSFTGAATPVTYTGSTNLGTTVTAQLRPTVTAPAPPTTSPDAFVTPAGTPAVVDVLANDDSGPAGTSFVQSSVRLVEPGTGLPRTTLTTDEGTFTVDTSTGRVTFTPAAGFSGPVPAVDYTVRTNTGATATGSLSGEVLAPPVARPDRATVPFSQDAVVDVLANDDPGDARAPLDPTTVQLRDPATGTWVTTLTVADVGTWDVDPTTGVVTFSPAAGFTGDTPAVAYRVADANGITASSTLLVTVGAAPVARDDEASTVQGQPTSLDPLTNDTPGTGASWDPTSVQLLDPADDTYKDSVTVAGVGTWTVDPTTGEVGFSPVPAYSGTASVGYQVTDSDGNTATATIAVAVAAVTPVARPDSGQEPFGEPIVVDVLANDSPGDPSAPLDPTTVQLRDPATGTWGTSVTVPDVGTYDVDPATGVVTFTPAPGFTRSAPALPYRVADANGTTVQSTIVVTSGPPPLGVNDSGTVQQGGTATVDVLDNDVFDDSSPVDPASLQLLDPADGTYKDSVTVPGVGTWTVGPGDGEVTFRPVPTYTGDAAISYRVSDVSGNSTAATLTVGVTAVTPTADPDPVTTGYEEPVTVPVLGNDTPGADDVPFVPGSVVLRDPADGSYKASVTIPGEGTYTVDPTDGSVDFVPAQGFSGPGTLLTYRVADTNGTTATSTLRVTVETPDLPMAQPDSTSTVQGEPATLDPLTNDGHDTDAPLQPGTLRLLDPADGVFKSSVTVPGVGTWTVDPATGAVTFTPVPTYVGDAQVAYRVADEAGQVTASTITVSVTAVIPTAEDDVASTAFGTPTTVDVVGNDAPGDPSAPLDRTTVQLRDDVNGGWTTDLTVEDVGRYTVDPVTGTVTFTPADGFFGPALAVTYRVADENGTFAQAALSVSVGAGPSASDDTADTVQGQPVVVDVLPNDTPGAGATWDASSVLVVDPADGVAKSAVTVTGVGTWSVDGLGRVVFTPVPEFTGSASVDYRATDSQGNSATASVTVTVSPVTPVVRDDTATTAFGTPVEIDVLGNDDPGDASASLDPTTVRLYDAATGTWVTTLTVDGVGTYTVDPTSGVVTFTPAPGYFGTAPSVTYRVADTNGTLGTGGLTVTVEQPPGADAAPDAVGTVGRAPVTIDPLANDTPSDGATFDLSTLCLVDPVSGDCLREVTVTGVGTWVVNDDGTVTFTPADGFEGTASIDYRVTDTNGVTIESTMSVVVAAPGEPTPTPSTTPSGTATPRPTGSDGDGPDASGGPLAQTGSDVLLVGGALGLLLVLAGGVVLAAARRRGDRSH